MFALSYTFSAFLLRKVSTTTSKRVSIKCGSNVFVLLCTAETEGKKPDKNNGSN